MSARVKEPLSKPKAAIAKYNLQKEEERKAEMRRLKAEIMKGTH